LGQEQAKMFSQVELYWKETLEMNGLFGEFVLSIIAYVARKMATMEGRLV